MLFHKKEKALEGQLAGIKPEKPRKVRWSERREPSEAGLERFQDYLQTYSTNKDHPIKILCSFYKGKQKKLVETGFFLILQRSPIWIIPIATSNIINAATNPDAGSLEIILLNVMVALLFIMQNAGTNYLATVAFASVNRGIEGSLRNAMVRKLQQLSIMFHKEVQSGRLQSKIMRDVENVTELLNQIFRTLFFFVLDISVIIVITLRKSPMVFLFFLVVVPFAVLTMRAFKKPVREKNQEFRSEMENTQGAVAEMLEMIPVARAHGLQEVEISKMNTYLNRIVDRGYNLDLINALFGAVNWVVFQSFQMICPCLYCVSGSQRQNFGWRGCSVSDLLHFSGGTDFDADQYLSADQQGSGVCQIHRRHHGQQPCGGKQFHCAAGGIKGRSKICQCGF